MKTITRRFPKEYKHIKEIAIGEKRYINRDYDNTEPTKVVKVRV